MDNGLSLMRSLITQTQLINHRDLSVCLRLANQNQFKNRLYERRSPALSSEAISYEDDTLRLPDKIWDA